MWIRISLKVCLFVFRQSRLLSNFSPFKEIFHRCRKRLDDLDYFTIVVEFPSIFFYPFPSWLGTLQFLTRDQILGDEYSNLHRKFPGGIWQRTKTSGFFFLLEMGLYFFLSFFLIVFHLFVF